MTREIKDGFVVRDRRYWVDDEERDAEEVQAPSPPEAPPPPAAPAIDAETLRSALADLEETKHRVRRDAEKQLELQRARVLESLLPVVDNLERSLEAAAGGGPDVKAFAEGVRLVHQQFLNALGNFGLERRSAVGERFDPRLHDAIALVPVNDPLQDGIVVAEMEPAYVAGDRVIRPARVQVGRAPNPAS
jgi:molecular chaperone GrpE (heat shock protein)